MGDARRADDVCDLFCSNADLVAQLKSELVGVPAMARVFRLLADETRCIILAALDRSDDLCVCDLAHVTGLSLPTVSHHLRKLREVGLVRSRREGKLVFYRLVDERIRRLLAEAARWEPVLA